MDQIEEIKARINIVDLISEYLQLKKAGRNMSALCPFHNEKTPSFMVSAERGSWHCFGCGKGGDAFTFLEEVEGIDFSQALEKLAAKAGVKLVKTRQGQQRLDLRNQLYQINELAAQFYHYLLTGHKLGSRARKYLKDRRILPESIRKFQLGYAPSDSSALYKFLTKKGFSPTEIASSGLVLSSVKGEYFDRFRDRIMFPLYDMVGRIVGFSGRIIEESKTEAKYLNTPNTPVFVKGSVLFGLPQAKAAIKEKDHAVLVEGEFDVISSHQAGVANVLGAKGTALTDDQISLIKRLTENVSVCFDADFAGDKAARRGVEMADQAGLNIKVVTLAGFKDPDEAARSDQIGWQSAVALSVGVYDWFLSWAKRTFDASDPIGKKKIGAELLPIFARINDEIVKAHYLSKLARALDVSEEVVYKALDKGDIGPQTQENKAEDRLVPEESGNLESYFIALLLQGSSFDCSIKIWPEVSDFEDPALKSIYAEIIMHKPYSMAAGVRGEKEFDLASFAKDKPESIVRTIDKLAVFDLAEAAQSSDVWQRSLLKAAKAMRERAIKKKLAIVRQKIGGEANLNKADFAKLNAQFKELTRELTGLGRVS